jgi:hypothetical protein
MFRKIFLLILLLLPFISFAQNDVEMADTFRSEGKIYVVIAVISLIFIGLLIYLISIDRKVGKMEKKIGK